MSDLKWWQKAVFYQVYPRSFADSNGDGIGDIPGIIDRLDYLKGLGIDAIWLSPHYPSPLYDCGYDVSDYTGVAPEYGTLDDFKRFLDGAHQRNLRVILDLVLNHTSDQHPWFIESRSSRHNPKHDWYIWRDGKDGQTPNNWYSAFGGSAWEYEPAIGQYYYHYFFKQQPDLNWRNPDMKQAMFDVVRFWLKMGVDGYRLDAIGTIFEDPDLPDQTAEFTQVDLFKAGFNATDEKMAYFGEKWKSMYRFQVDQPDINDLLRELRVVVDEFDNRVLVGESDKIQYCADDQLHMVFNFPLMRTRRLTPSWIRKNQKERLKELKKVSTSPQSGWPCNTLGNHDSPRVYSQYSCDPGINGQNDALARLHLALMLTLRGTPFLYNGEEIGMTDLQMENIDQFRDMMGVRLYQLGIQYFGFQPEEALLYTSQISRDKCRTPMQWNNSPNAGFSPAQVQPWLPVNPNYSRGINVADQEKNTKSLLHFYRRLLKLRKEIPALIAGDYTPLRLGKKTDEQVLVFLRSYEGQVCLVVLNLGDQVLSLDLLKTTAIKKLGDSLKIRTIYSSHQSSGDDQSDLRIKIAPFEIYIAELIPIH